jgi:hypothetical protein
MVRIRLLGKSDSCPRRVQPVALGDEILSLLLIRVPHPWFVHPPLMTLSGDVRQVLHCDRPQAGPLTTRSDRVAIEVDKDKRRRC